MMEDFCCRRNGHSVRKFLSLFAFLIAMKACTGQRFAITLGSKVNQDGAQNGTSSPPEAGESTETQKRKGPPLFHRILRRNWRPKKMNSDGLMVATNVQKESDEHKTWSEWITRNIKFIKAVAYVISLGILGSFIGDYRFKADEHESTAENSNASKQTGTNTSQYETQDVLGSHESVEVGFENIKLILKGSKGGDRELLDGSLKGSAKPGRLLAIMGPSGSGKTSLLNALAGHIKYSEKLELSGRRFVNGELISGDSEIPSAYILQEPIFFPYMTVKETLDFRAKLKLSKTMTKKADRDHLVEQLLHQLDLKKSADTIVGNAGVRGISGGERKRLSIACEMITSPPILFLDEPTSGLDSYQAGRVVDSLRSLAEERDKTVVAVIHQPNHQIFSKFDDLLLMAEGKLMYFGEVTKVRKYFEQLGYSPGREVGTAEHILECISRTNDRSPSVVEETNKRIDRIAEAAKSSTAASGAVSKNTKGMKQKRLSPLQYGTANIFQQFRLLLVRSLHEVFRSKGALIIKTMQQVFLGFVYGAIYGLGNNQNSIRDRIGLLSLIAIGTANVSLAQTLRSFTREKTIVQSEIRDKLYSTVPYFVAKAISEIPPVGLFNAIFASIIYPLTGLQKGRFRQFFGIVTLHSIASEAIGLLIGAFSPSTDFALALMPPVVVLGVIFDGKNLSEESVPKLLRWLPKIGAIRWCFETLAVNEFTGLVFNTKGPRRGPVLKTGEEALAQFGLGERTVADGLSALGNIVAVSWFLSWLGLTVTGQKYLEMGHPL